MKSAIFSLILASVAAAAEPRPSADFDAVAKKCHQEAVDRFLALTNSPEAIWDFYSRNPGFFFQVIGAVLKPEEVSQVRREEFTSVYDRYSDSRGEMSDIIAYYGFQIDPARSTHLFMIATVRLDDGRCDMVSLRTGLRPQ